MQYAIIKSNKILLYYAQERGLQLSTKEARILTGTYLTEEEREAFEAMCNAEHRTISNMIRFILLKELTAQGYLPSEEGGKK